MKKAVSVECDFEHCPLVYGYSAYGETQALGVDGDIPNNANQYTARENDGLIGGTGGEALYYYRARHYDTVLKRFIAEDPIGLSAGVNLWMYVGGNPAGFVDPWGLMGRAPGSGSNWPTNANRSCDCPDSSPSYWDLVMRNYNQTTSVLPWWTNVPGLNPFTALTAGAVAQQVGGLTLRAAIVYHGTVLAANAYVAAGATAVINGVLVIGALKTGMLIGSMVSPYVINAALSQNSCH